MNRFYITPEEYDIAAANGIDRGTVNARVRGLAWDVEKAIGQPIQCRGRWLQWRETAAKHGICYQTFTHRIYHGWEPERAATEPPWPKYRVAELGRATRWGKTQKIRRST